MPGLGPGIHVFLVALGEDVDGRDISAFTRVFNALRPAMTWRVCSFTSRVGIRIGTREE
jgi:hypothetical protein